MIFIFKTLSIIHALNAASQLCSYPASSTSSEIEYFPQYENYVLINGIDDFTVPPFALPEETLIADSTEEFIRQKEREARYPSGYAPQGPQYALPLPMVPPSTLQLEDELSSAPYSYSVVLDPQLKTKLFAEILFPVKKVYKKLGDRFEANETLIELDDRILKGNLVKAEAVWQKTKTELNATQSLYDKKVASEFELKDAGAKEATAYSDFVTASRQLETSKIHVPYAGKVEGVYIEDYELPQTGRELIEVINDNVLVARLLIPAILLKQISIGQPIKITLVDTGEVIDAKIARIGAMIDPASSTIKLEAEIENPGGRIKPGSVGRVIFETTTPPKEFKQP